MFLEIQDAEIKRDKLIFKLEYDEEFRLEVGKIRNISNPTKKDVQEYIFNVIENTINLEDLAEQVD